MHNFVTKEFVWKLGVTSIANATLSVTSADRSVLHTMQVAMLHLQLYDDMDHVIPQTSTPVTCYVLDIMPAPVVLGRP